MFVCLFSTFFCFQIIIRVIMDWLSCHVTQKPSCGLSVSSVILLILLGKKQDFSL